MIKLENTVLPSPEQWEAIIRGMRNPMNSWDKSDSAYGCDVLSDDDSIVLCEDCTEKYDCGGQHFSIGPNDYTLMKNLAKAGSDHSKYKRMIVVYVDITAPLYWWKEFDTYKVGTVANSCSTMHKIHAKEFTMDDFSHDRMSRLVIENLHLTVKILNAYRSLYINWDDVSDELKNQWLAGVELSETGEYTKKMAWDQMIQLLPSSYNQRRTVELNYEVLANMYRSRKNHKLREWVELCEWIKTLPYSDLITMEENDNAN